MSFQRIYWGSLYFILGLYFISTLVLQEPFLHPEAVMQAHWWNEKGYSFLNILFDTWKTDQHPGRFRFLTYFVEGSYWRLFKWGLIPGYFYDYSAILINLATAGLIWKACEIRKIKPVITFALVAAFILSAPVYMTSTWHCRKAKFLASLLLATYFYLRSKPGLSGRFSFGLVMVAVLGVITDPYFILLFPLLVLAMDLQDRKSIGVRSGLLGYFIAFLLICLLNGVIGPWLNPKTQLIFHNFEHIPDYYFNLENVSLFPTIFLDLVGPMMLYNRPNLSWAFLFLSIAVTAILFWRSSRKPYLYLAFLLVLPISAFMVEPKTITARFGTYYGHPVFLFFLFGLLDLMQSLEKVFPKFLLACLLVLIPITVLHQFGKHPLFQGWRGGAFVPKPISLYRYNEDEALLNRLRMSDFDPLHPIQIELRGRERYKPEWGYTYPEKDAPLLPHHDLGYLMIPLLFEKEIEEGSLKIIPSP